MARWIWVAVAVAVAGCGERRARSAGAELLATPAQLDFGPTGLGSRKELGLRVRNEGRTPINVLEARVTVPNVLLPEFAPFTLASGEERIVALQFAPTVEGEVTGALELTTDAQNVESGVSVHPIVGIAVRGYVEVGAHALDFGKVPIDTVVMQAFTVRNPTSVQAPLSLAFEGEEASAFSSVDADKGLTLAPGELKTLAVAFRPSKLGLASATVRLAVCAACEPVLVELSGTGIAQLVNVFPLGLDFGRVALGASAQDKVTLVNDGNEPVRVERISVDEPVYSLVSPPVLPLTLLPAQKLEIPVAFKPAATGPAKRGVLEVAVSAQNVVASGYKLPVRGEGGSTCIQLNPRTLDFGVVPEGMSVTHRVDVINRCFEGVQLGDFAVATSAGGFFSLGQPAAMQDVPAGGIVPVTVTFTPKPGSGQSAAGLTFKVYERNIVQPQAVPVTGSTRAFAPCRYSLTPAALDYGNVPVGAEVTLGLALRNDGTDQCFVSGFQLASGSDDAFSTAGIASALLEPGQQAVLPVKVKPMATGSFSALVEAFVNHPTAGHPSALLKANGVSSCLALQPTTVDFGVTKLSCGVRTRTVTAVNGCTQPVTVQSAKLSQATSSELAAATPTLPATLQPGQSAAFTVSYAPTDDGTDSAALEVNAGAAGVFVAGLIGRGASKPDQLDRFFQDSQTKVDVLFVIDNSGSMMEEQQSLGQNFAAFLTAAQAANVDYHIGVTTTGIEGSPGGWAVCPGGVDGGEAGRLFPANGAMPRVITPATPNAGAVFASNVQVGWCHWNEQGLEGAYRALSAPLVNNADDPRTALANDGNLGFLRADAKLVLIFVTDEDDFSPQPVSFYETFFRAVKGNDPQLLSISAIIGPENLASCPTASSAGVRYAQLTKATGGLAESICTANWAASLQNLSHNTFGPRRRFVLTQQPADPTLISVQVNGAPVTSGWSYDAAAQTVEFDSNHSPAPGAMIEITYPLGC